MDEPLNEEIHAIESNKSLRYFHPLNSLVIESEHECIVKIRSLLSIEKSITVDAEHYRLGIAEILIINGVDRNYDSLDIVGQDTHLCDFRKISFAKSLYHCTLVRNGSIFLNVLLERFLRATGATQCGVDPSIVFHGLPGPFKLVSSFRFPVPILLSNCYNVGIYVGNVRHKCLSAIRKNSMLVILNKTSKKFLKRNIVAYSLLTVESRHLEVSQRA